MIYKIKIIGEYDKKEIEKIQNKYYKKVDGIYEIYTILYMYGYGESYCKDRIYYIGYTLAKHNIDFKIEEV